MTYLAREDGERFVIPSYRDVLSKRKTLIKDDILELSSRYGEYMTFLRRGLAQFEVAFSQDAGYLFGECVWHYFKRPADLIYCEIIPETTEAYFVIVKGGSVYLDGTFPLESIAEEVQVFTTQQTHFEIYVYGDVPISDQPMEGKVCFDPSTVKSFNRLSEPLFQRLPVVNIYQLQLVDVVLRQQGIGIFPVKYVLAVVLLLGLAWMGFSYLNWHKKSAPLVKEVSQPVSNPYFEYNTALMSPAPELEIEMLVLTIDLLTTMPGWIPIDINYSGGKVTVNVKSLGTNLDFLYDWAKHSHASLMIMPGGFSLNLTLPTLPKRPVPNKIYPLDRVMMSLMDRVGVFIPGNKVQVISYKTQAAYKEAELRIELQDASPALLFMVAEQLKDLPLVLTDLTLRINHGLTGSIRLRALGN